ncbi:YxeA family protein [Bacillus sp. JAS24-2]|uniref:YxeA family protein n=1 Tax=Bacillus sp. JAS24-2 TaxID=2217832 RepID=UPI0021042BAB|nr:YxeA family protein [Bacillus sp. JAS24-2]
MILKSTNGEECKEKILKITEKQGFRKELFFSVYHSSQDGLTSWEEVKKANFFNK